MKLKRRTRQGSGGGFTPEQAERGQKAALAARRAKAEAMKALRERRKSDGSGN